LGEALKFYFGIPNLKSQFVTLKFGKTKMFYKKTNDVVRKVVRKVVSLRKAKTISLYTTKFAGNKIVFNASKLIYRQ
jgi:hypothetical protein